VVMERANPLIKQALDKEKTAAISGISESQETTWQRQNVLAAEYPYGDLSYGKLSYGQLSGSKLPYIELPSHEFRYLGEL
ncbi:hypothetical protein SK128_025823, partial [Halocaridina rubra]